MGSRRDTPAMRQYASFKERHPDCVLFFRMGDFYEMFDDDAVTAHKALGLTLTQRSEGIPMAGVPYHQLDTYLRRMIEAGFRVAVCDQVQDPKEAKGVVARAVTRVVTPGTLVEDSLLSDDAANTLAAVCFLEAGEAPDARVGVAIAELSTGAFTILDCRADELADELARRRPAELLYAEAGMDAPPRVARVLEPLGLSGTPRPGWHFRASDALESLLEQYGVTTLAGFGLSDDDPAIAAAGAIVRYMRETQALDASDLPTSEGASSGSAAAMTIRKRSLAHLAPPRRESHAHFLKIDAVSLRALEVEQTVRTEQVDGSLLGVLSQSTCACRTAMGKRLLREWLCRPLADRALIEARQSAVATLVEDTRSGRALAEAIDGVQDVARIVARVGLGRATPRDVVALGRSLGRIDAITSALQNAPAFETHRASLEDVRTKLEPVAQRIEALCVESPPAHLREGGLIRDGMDAALDEARGLQRDSHAWLAEYQASLIEEHDLPSLKVGFNKVFGYYIELPAAQARRAPAQFTRKQTLKNAERYITPELKEYEDKVLSAGDIAVQRELELFASLCDEVAGIIGPAGRFAETVAELDVLGCFARRASMKQWVRPMLADEPALDITQGRHPVLEEILGGEFVPNDCGLGRHRGTEAQRHEGEEQEPSAENNDGGGNPPGRSDGHDGGASLALITGPNMAGKSTYIRQVALITLLAHTGSFVPAEAATIGLTDRIFTRIGADDALHRGQSTFMVEMIETANILHNATDRSLVILDEIGRGTSTLDGLSLAWALAEFLSDGATQRRSDEGGEEGTEGADEGHAARRSSGPRTLFATHYHELTDLAERLPGRVVNLHVAVREWGEEIVFLHHIRPGRASGSYGIHVARLAGLPTSVIDRANDLLQSLTVSHAAERSIPAQAQQPSAPSGQMSLFTEYVPHPVLEELKGVDLTRLSPLDAFDALRRMQEKVSDGATAPEE
ncbi:MAG: DNA mismatch repair protein MutS [Planctomycetota bacterium]